MLIKPPRCWRNRSDCEPLHSVEAIPENMTKEDWGDLEGGRLDPDSFVCGGCVKEPERVIPQDAYRVCWKNDEVDEMGEYDEQDIAHQLTVLSQMVACIASRRTNSGMIEVPTEQGSPVD